MANEPPLTALGDALWKDLGVEGVYARTGLFEQIVEQLGLLLTRERDARVEVLHFPPVMSRSQLERSGYLQSFPNLLGCICALHGTEPQIRAAAGRHESGGDWTEALTASDLVLTPAACYPLYPLLARAGAVPREGYLFDVSADCFRHEPSRALDRLQSFRMREFVCIGAPAEVQDFRAGWMQRGEALARSLELPGRLEGAADPFFGRVGLMLAMTQRQQALKFELLIPLHPAAAPTACMSFNCHLDHFASIWGLAGPGGGVVHTGCVAFGLDRLAVALFARHGLEPARWPAAVRGLLGL
jgi:seryl-tRNA synthetase